MCFNNLAVIDAAGPRTHTHVGETLMWKMHACLANVDSLDLYMDQLN